MVLVNTKVHVNWDFWNSYFPFYLVNNQHTESLINMVLQESKQNKIIMFLINFNQNLNQQLKYFFDVSIYCCLYKNNYYVLFKNSISRLCSKQLSLKQFCLDLQLNLILNQMQSSTHHYYYFIFQLKYVFDI